MQVTIIGNGFDLRHKMPTSIHDFLKSDIVKSKMENIIISYYQKQKVKKGWVDFENDLLMFFEYIEEFRNSVKFIKNEGKAYYIVRADFINSYNAKLFYDVIYDSKRLDKLMKSGSSIKIVDEDWENELATVTVNDYKEFKNLLIEYLKSVEKDNDSIKLATSEIDIIENSDKVFTFNYTNTLERYIDFQKIHYVHGSLKKNIILGVPFSNKVNIVGLQNIFKITQSAKLRLNRSIIDSRKNRVDLHFIGFSFGLSDHYFFQELRDWTNNVTVKDLTNIPHLHFHLHYHNDDSLNGMLNNLRQFLGEEMFTRFDLQKRINFAKYENANLRN